MPTGYAGEGKVFLKKTGRWVKKEKERAFDYESLSEEQKRSVGLIVSVFRFYPDYFFDMIRSENARFKQQLPQRLMLRIFARYRNVYCTGGRGLTKTSTIIMSKSHEGVFFPGEKIRYVAPAQKQSATLASDAFRTMEENYPLLASWWAKNNDRSDMFRISTPYGSVFTMYAPRGDNCSSVVGEEMAQEGENGFDMDKFENDISPACRIIRMVKGKKDRTHINLKETYISNASSRQNPAFTKYRHNALLDMVAGQKYDGYCIDIPWECALLCNLRDIEYYKKEKKKLTHEAWLREMCVRYTGNDENPLISDETLAKSRRLRVMEEKHSGDINAIYIVSHDVSYVDSAKNAKCADVVLKLTDFTQVSKRDKYRKQAVYADNYPPPKDAYTQAKKLKELWMKYCLDGGNATYLVVDAQAYGTEIVEELMKPSTDGTPTLCCINHEFSHLEQKGALPVIYPMKAGVRGSKDPDAEMIQYAQVEFERGNVELLIPNVLDGVEEYRKKHGIKDMTADGKIAMPYRNSDLLAQQIGNLRVKVSGTSFKEERKSKSIQRDIWSALKYALRLAQRLEDERKGEKYKVKSSWSAIIAAGAGSANGTEKRAVNNDRSRLLALRR